MAEKILIITPSWIGDCVMTQPMLRCLHERYVDCCIDVLAPAWSRAVFARMPEVNKIIDNPFGHGALCLRERWYLGRILGKQGYTRVIVLPGSFKSALIAAASGIPIRTGYVGEQRYFLLNDIRKLDKAALPLMVDRYTALVGDSEQTLVRHGMPPRLYIDDVAKAEALRQFGLILDKKVMAFCPGAEYGAAKRWPARHFAKTAKYYVQQGWQVWLFGSAKDEAIADQIQALCGDVCTNLCGQTDLSQAIDLLSCANTVVCNDSGLMHLAAAVGCRVVAVYGSSSAQHTPPLSAAAVIATLNLPCSPCFQRECPFGHTDCLEKLLPQQVIALQHELTGRQP